MKRRISLMAQLAVVLWLAMPHIGYAQRGGALAREAACNTLNLASTGGPMPRDPHVLVLRYLGSANHELIYRDNVFLLDAHYDRAAPARPLGFNFTDMKKATALFIGHAHSDHVSDAVAVAQQTGARVFGGPPTSDFVIANGLPGKQGRARKGRRNLEVQRRDRADRTRPPQRPPRTGIPESGSGVPRNPDGAAAAPHSRGAETPRSDRRSRQPRPEIGDRRHDRVPLHIRRRLSPVLSGQRGPDHRPAEGTGENDRTGGHRSLRVSGLLSQPKSGGRDDASDQVVQAADRAADSSRRKWGRVRRYADRAAVYGSAR